jgi:hypothetical protein
MTDDDQRVDPRYDPAFQRGFDGPVTTGQRPRSVQRPGLVAPAPYRAETEVPHPDEVPLTRSADAEDRTSSADRTPDRTSRADRTPDRMSDRMSDRAPEPISDRTPDHISDPASDPDHVSSRRLTRNPFLVALVVLGLTLTIGGIALANQARMLVSVRGGAATDLDYWFLQSSVVAAPLAIIAGVGILSGVLFVAAAAWNRR